MSVYKTKGELKFESEFIETLTHSGWTHNSQLDNAKPKDLENHFREILNQNNHKSLNGVELTDVEMSEVMRNIASKTPAEMNEFLTGNYVAIMTIAREDPELGNVDLQLFWRDDIAGGAMRYEVIRQAIRPGKEDKPDSPSRRFDVTLLFNGLPLIQVEEKKVDVNIKEASNQIIKYKTENQYDGLYSAVQVFVALKEDAVRYFANEKSADMFNNKFFFEWLDVNNRPVHSWKQFTDDFLKIPMAHHLISDYIIADGPVLKVLRPYQIHAVNAVIRAAKKHEDGYVWHATGSGKTLTAYKIATLLQRDANNQVIFMSDRKELDNQSGKNFSTFSQNSDDTVFETTRTDQLVKVLRSSKPGIITTTINKMKNAVERNNEKVEAGKRGPLEKIMNKRMIFIVDEAHRSQFGEMQRVIKQGFPKQNWYGFTGTPIFDFNKTPQDQTTESQFGPELHRYNIGNALSDGAILPFQSEYVSVVQAYDSENEVDDATYPDEIYKGDNDEAAQYRLKVVNWIIKNWQRKSVKGRFNALLATSDIEQANAFYKLFKQLEAEGKHHLKVAITYSLNENGDDNAEQRECLVEAMKDYSLRYAGTETAFSLDNLNVYIDDVAKRTARNEAQYKNLNPEEEIDLTIVVARLLTGFDAPRLNTLYLDKLMQYQGLIQAFARTNRIYDKNKSQGNIVMFRKPNLMKIRTEDAFEKYAGEGSFEKVFRPDISEMEKEFITAINELKKLVPTPEDANDLTSGREADKIEFLNRFKDLSSKLQYISSYSEFNWSKNSQKYGMDDEEFGYYQGAFVNVKDSLIQPNGGDPDEDDPELRFDFDDVIISELRIDKEYVLGFATKTIQNVDDLFAKDKFNEVASKWAKSGNAREAENIRRFVTEQKKRTDITSDYDAVTEYSNHQRKQKQKKIDDFANSYGLDSELLSRLVDEYETSGEFLHEQELKNTANMKIAERNGHKYQNMLQYKGQIQRNWREFITADLSIYLDEDKKND